MLILRAEIYFAFLSRSANGVDELHPRKNAGRNKNMLTQQSEFACIARIETAQCECLAQKSFIMNPFELNLAYHVDRQRMLPKAFMNKGSLCIIQ